MALLLNGAGLFTHERVVPVNLAGKSRPAMGDISQHLGLGCTLRQTHQAKTFCRLILAMLCAVHHLLASKPVPKTHDRYIYSQQVTPGFPLVAAGNTLVRWAIQICNFQTTNSGSNQGTRSSRPRFLWQELRCVLGPVF